MAEHMTTREMIDKYTASKTNMKTPEKFITMIDRKELFEYEEEIGKQLIEMNADEIMYFLKNKIVSKSGRRAPFSTVYIVANCYRNMIEWYNETYHASVYNPFNAKQFSAHNLSMALADETDVFTTQDMEDLISGVRRYYDVERADFIELMIRLFYSGFSKSTEIIAVKEEDISPKTRTIRLADFRTITLDEKTFNLAQRVHEMKTIPFMRGNLIMTPYHGSYFTLPTRASQVDKINDKQPTIACAYFHNCIKTAAKDIGFSKDVSYMILYHLGFYDTLVKTYGVERANAILNAQRDSGKADDFRAAAQKYGIVDDIQQFRNKIVSYIHQ